MNFAVQKLKDTVLPKLSHIIHDTECDRIHALLFWVFALSIITFPLGQAFRESGPIIGLLLLGWYYYRNWEHSNLRKFKLKYLFAIFYALIIFKIIDSVVPATSYKTVSPNLWKGFVLPFIGMEAVRSTKDLRILTMTLAATCILQGFDGIWQFITGFDLVHRTPIMTGRLTGSMSTYRVGDYIAMIGIPAAGIWALLPRSFSSVKRIIATVCILSPAIFLLIFAQSRSGYLGAIAGIYMIWLLFLGRPTIWTALAPLLCGVLFTLLGPKRISIETALQDQRWDLWQLAWRVFEANPLLGVGAGAYNAGFKALGLLPVVEDPSIQHPHNIYLQFLCDTGIIGFAIAMLFFIAITGWSAWRIRTGLRSAAAAARQHWELAAFFWGGWLCYIANGIGSHDFYRTWWLATAMTVLGITLGACLSSPTALQDKDD